MVDFLLTKFSFSLKRGHTHACACMHMQKYLHTHLHIVFLVLTMCPITHNKINKSAHKAELDSHPAEVL